MRTVFVFMLFFSSVVTENSTVINQLCSYQKSKLTCMCRYEKKPISNFPVRTADCTRLSLNQFPRDEQISDVEDLDLSYNVITDLNSDLNNFESFKLFSLKLAFNKITSVSQDFFINIQNLKELDLSHNDIVSFVNSNIFRGLSNLTTLNLGFNKLSTVPEDLLKPLLKLKALDLRYNYLGATLMNADDFFKTTLGVSSSIEILKLDGLDITQLNHSYFQSASNLKYLSLNYNPLNEIPKLPYSINYLDLSGTHLENISAKHLDYHSLKVLKLNKLKKLQKIEHYAFYNLIALEELHLSDARSLTEFSDLVFGVITENIDSSLKKLHLARTGIKKLNSTFLSLFKKLELIDLQNNPWSCSCEILWLQKLNRSLYRNDNLRCSYPINLRIKEIMKLTPTNLPNCYNGTKGYQRIMISILGILIGILSLLILYLIYLGPFHQSRRGIGPDSPYRGQTIGIDPNKAEDLN